MKSARVKADKFKRQPRGNAGEVSTHSLQKQIQQYKSESDILLALSNDITSVRRKNDLIKLFSSRLRSYFNFTHAVISLIDEKNGVYFPFLLDEQTHPSKDHTLFQRILVEKNSLKDPFIQKVIEAGDQTIIQISDIINDPNLPLFLRPQYESGIRHVLITPLRSQTKIIGFVYISAPKANWFTEEFRHVLQWIGPHLSNAVSNIIINDEILQKDRDKSFLVEFSRYIASARTKEELSIAIHQSLKKLAQVKAYFIHTINKDGDTLSSFMHDEETYYKNDFNFTQLLRKEIRRNVGLTSRVLLSVTPVTIEFEEEMLQNNTDPFIEFWKELGAEKYAFRKMTGVPLRIGAQELGVMWIITDHINVTLLDGISAQISVAISNIRNNEEIVQREEEKSILLSLSNEIAALRSKEDLLHVVNTRIKSLFSIEEFGLIKINDGGDTYGAFMLDVNEKRKSEDDYIPVTTATYDVKDALFSRIMHSEDPMVLNVNELAATRGMPAYVNFWKRTGILSVLGMRLRAGGRNVGCAFLYITPRKAVSIKLNLLKAVCAHLSVAIANIIAHEKLLAYKKQLEVENDYLKEQIKTIYSFGEIVGKGHQMQKVFHLMSLVAETNSTVLLLGETGTGKELIARAIHSTSLRKGKLMIKVNCATLPPNLIESELFGHEKGAFTGAIERRIGKFELANNSTLFLDEIGEMPLETQVKLLRVLQERELERVGGQATIKVDVRIIAATNRNLENEVKAGRFRSDLYYRLNVFPIMLPSLRDRKEDISQLASYFLDRYGKNAGRNVLTISSTCLKQMQEYNWPGNVRELEHLIERSILLTKGSELTNIPLPNLYLETAHPTSNPADKNLQQLEKDYIIEVLKRCKGKISGQGGAAAVLEIPATTLHSKMKKLEIAKADYFIKGA